MKRATRVLGAALVVTLVCGATLAKERAYRIVDTGQTNCYGRNGRRSACPEEGEALYGQDAQYSGAQAQYRDNGDGTITDLVTGLMWQKGFTLARWSEAEMLAAKADTGGFSDWRVPTTKELYSLIDFSGNQGSAPPDSKSAPRDAVPFIDTDYFDFEYPDFARYIDAQYIARTLYVGRVMDGQRAFFGVNLADGRIKGYPSTGRHGRVRKFYLRLVRGNERYGKNRFVDNGDGTITDEATGLMWLKYDSGDPRFSALLKEHRRQDGPLSWEEALSFSENLVFAGHDDWRLPNAKELHSIVDYTRAPDVTDSPAIDPVFETTGIVNEAGDADYPFFWSSTSFNGHDDAVIVQFGRSLGYMALPNGRGKRFYDVHGAGGQRTDPKSDRDGPTYGRGPQGDVRRGSNFVRAVRDVD